MSRYPTKKPVAKKAPAKKKAAPKKGKGKRLAPEKTKARAMAALTNPKKQVSQKAFIEAAEGQMEVANALAAAAEVNFAREFVDRGAATYVKPKRARFRDAITGLFLRARDALRRKGTTVRERY